MAGAGGQQVLSPYHAMGCNPVTMVDPLGLMPLIKDNNVDISMPEQALYYASLFSPAVIKSMSGYDFDGDYASHLAFHAKFVEEQMGLNEYKEESVNGVESNGESGGTTKPNTDYMVFDGTTVTFYDGNDNHVMFTYEATSGLPGYQNSGNQKISDSGPLPEDEYSVNLKLDPKRQVKINNRTGERYPGNGIEYFPSSFTALYLHDPHKGYSHGCIEVNSGLFNTLIGYSYFRPSITLYVKYPNNNSSTNGGTYRP